MGLRRGEELGLCKTAASRVKMNKIAYYFRFECVALLGKIVSSR